VIADAAVHGRAVPANLIGELTDSRPLLEDGPQLRARFESDGYAFFRGALDDELVQSAREEVLARLEEVDEVEPGSDGVFTGRSERDALHPDRGKFWQSVSTGDRLRQASHGAGARRLVEAIIGEAVVPFDYLMLRVATPGRATEVHYDYPFFARLHDQVRTVWIPIGDVPVERGPVFVVEGSNRFEDVIADLRGFEVTAGSSRKAAFNRTAIELADERGTHLLTTDFGAGDVLVFGMYTAHGSFDHHDETRRVRVSCDARWQARRLSVDGRYMGAHPSGTTGAGYAELNGAKPLTETWHVR
jgi:ectoine hydroxylase-related dioxygenase (phytanoyl-CoA dioxygenase family)